MRKRPTDMNQLGKLIVDIAIGQVADEDDGGPSKDRTPAEAQEPRAERRPPAKPKARPAR